MNSHYSDELINTFVDGELDGQEKMAFRKAMAEDSELSARVNALCELKQSVQLSYSHIIDTPDYGTVNSSVKYNNLRQVCSAAIIFLITGVTFGWLSHHYIGNKIAHSTTAESINGIKLTPVNMQQSNRIIMHIASSAPDKLKATLDKIESILSQYQENKLPFELEIIANAGGIDLLRKDVSPYQARIASIMKTNRNVSFIACSNAMDRLRTLGIEPDLIAETKSDRTAVEQIVKRLQQGWVYVKV
ncbi:MAG: hypothetical protein OQK76_11015 [Gammaproteobacteria bacterium]|nr:hypothetical protein [Gammaproteobacteria bacterium]MCW8911134.1 hypothetical protein [Gammaproteobacteria bacterium]MCW9004665.1 hypothetical protein [Gammaproteobacteria bacterium]MCW9056992.1 hypothetical protein [Gammaproteobacteria bacterium]